MPSVVIVHVPEDAPPARALAEKLTALGLTPVIGQPPGELLRKSMREAGAVVALWSPRSSAAPELLGEVAFARELGPVIHARMQNAASPPDFANDGSIDLTGWRGEDGFPAWRELAGAIASRVGMALPTARPAAQSPFCQPGASGATAPAATTQRTAAASAPPRAAPPPRPVPPPRAPRLEPEETSSGSGRLVLIGIITFLVVAVLGGGGYFAFTQMQGSQAVASTWEGVDKTDPDQIRAFIAGNPGGLRGEAEETLATLDQQMFEAAQARNTLEAYRAYVEDFPDGGHALQARGRIAELESALPPVTETTTEAIDPLTGLPYAPDDLVPPDSAAGAPGAPLTPAPAPSPFAPPATPDPNTGGPTPLTQPDDPGAPVPAN